MTTISFTYDKSLDSTNHAGLANVSLIGTLTDVHFTRVLVDSGADYVQLPMFSASGSGIDMTTASPVSVNGVGGTVTMYLRPSTKIEIEGKSVTVDVLFDPANGRPLLGRNGLRALGDEYGFDLNDWLWNT